MKNLIKNVAKAAILLVIANSCNKKPTADFATDKSEYNVGETIQLESKSKDAKSFRWTLPDGTTATSEKISYPTSDLGYDYTLQFKLEVFSKRGNKSDVIVKNIKVNAKKGNVVISSPGSYGNLSVDGVHYGTIYTSYGPTTCGQQGFATISLPIGQHVLVYTYYDNSSVNPSVKTATVNISENGCTVCAL